MSLPPIFVGLDPGKSGGIAVLESDLSVGETCRRVQVWPMPETYRDLYDSLKRVADYHGPKYGALEQVSASPQMGVTSAFTFGTQFGRLYMAATVCDLRLWVVRPQAWQKLLGIPPRKKTEGQPQFKKRLRKLAQELFPTVGWQRMGVGKSLAISDALLLAEYCRRIVGLMS